MSKEPLFVTCPVCGKVNQKSLFTYSEVRCQRCHRELTAFADLGVVVGIDMNKKGKWLLLWQGKHQAEAPRK